MAHAQKPDFFFLRNRTSPLKSAGASVQSTTGSQGVRISGSNAGYTTFPSVNSTGYPLHSPASPSLPHPCITVCHHISTGLLRANDHSIAGLVCPTIGLPPLQTFSFRESNHDPSDDQDVAQFLCFPAFLPWISKIFFVFQGNSTGETLTDQKKLTAGRAINYSKLIRSNYMQQYAGIYLLQNTLHFSGVHRTRHQEYIKL